MDKPQFFARHFFARPFFTRHSRWIIPLFIIAGAILVTVVLAVTRSAPPKEVEVTAGAPVEVESVVLKPLRLTVHSQGMVEPKYQTELVAQVSGELIQIADAFARGGIVDNGEILAAIDPTNYEVRLEEARAAVASARAALELEQAQGQVARLEWEKVNDTPPPALGLRKPQLAQAEAQLVAARAALKQAEKDLERTRITAPYDALVAARDVSLGSFVNVGTRLGEVLDISTAQIRLPLAGSELRYLEGKGVGAAVLLTGSANGEAGQWQAKIVRTEGVIDSDTRMAYLVAEVPDPYLLDGERQSDSASILPFGSYLAADISGILLPSAARVPRYLIKDGRVALAQDDKLVFRPVEVIRTIGGFSVVVDGLTLGDQMIATAMDYPVEGMALDILGREETAKTAPDLALSSAKKAVEDAVEETIGNTAKATDKEAL